MSQPRIKVSVVIPNYNHARLLPRCLDAVLEQPVPADEVLVLDDGSKDNSLEVLATYAKKWPNLRVHPNERNLGVVATMNRGLGLATGDYIGFFAADDRVLPGLFERMLPLLEAHPEAGIISGLCEWRCEDTGLTWYQGSSMPARAGYLAPSEMVALARAGRLSIAAQHGLFKRTALIDAGGWIPELRWFTDCFSTWVVGFRHGVCHVPEVLSVFHTTQTSYYHSAKNAAERRETIERMLDLLGTPKYADAAGPIRESGLIGGLGSAAFRVVVSNRRFRSYFNAGLIRHTTRRSAEVIGRRILPGPVARLAARIFYGRR